MATKKTSDRTTKPRGRVVPPAATPAPVDAPTPPPPPPPQSMDEIITRLEADNKLIETERQRIATNANMELNRLQGIMESNLNTIQMLRGLPPVATPQQVESDSVPNEAPATASATEQPAT